MRYLAVALAVALFVFFPRDALAHHNNPDSDGRVPHKKECNPHPDTSKPVQLGWTDGYTVKNPSGKVIEAQWVVHVDVCAIRSLGGGREDIRTVYLHEMAHAEGWNHEEKPKEKNAAFDSGILLTGK